MKKAAAVFLVVLLLAGSAFSVMAFSVNRERDQVQFDEQVRYGEQSHAEGLTVSMKAAYDKHLFWDMVYQPGKQPPVQTDFTFRAGDKPQPSQRRWRGLQIEVQPELPDNEMLVSDEPLSGISAEYQKLFRETKPGEAAEREVDLSEIYEFLPLIFDMDLPGIQWSNRNYSNLGEGKNNCEKEVIEKFREFFRIPTPKNSHVYMELRKRKDGGPDMLGYSGSTGDGSGCHLDTVSTMTEDTCYFTFFDISEKKIDFSRVPGGYGLYSFAFEPVRSYEEGGFSGIHAESLRLFFPLAEGTEVHTLQPDAEQKNLILITGEGTKHYFNVIRLADGKLLQKFAFLDQNETGFQAYDFADFWVVDTFDRLIVIQRQENGEYVFRFSVEQKDISPTITRNNWFAMDFDGEKLAIAGICMGSKYANFPLCDFYLMVYDRTGMLCCMEYPCSLSRAPNLEQYGFNCLPKEITVSWE